MGSRSKILERESEGMTVRFTRGQCAEVAEAGNGTQVCWGAVIPKLWFESRLPRGGEEKGEGEKRGQGS